MYIYILKGIHPRMPASQDGTIQLRMHPSTTILGWGHPGMHAHASENACISGWATPSQDAGILGWGCPSQDAGILG